MALASNYSTLPKRASSLLGLPYHPSKFCYNSEGYKKAVAQLGDEMDC